MIGVVLDDNVGLRLRACPGCRRQTDDLEFSWMPAGGKDEFVLDGVGGRWATPGCVDGGGWEPSSMAKRVRAGTWERNQLTRCRLYCSEQDARCGRRDPSNARCASIFFFFPCNLPWLGYAIFFFRLNKDQRDINK